MKDHCSEAEKIKRVGRKAEKIQACSRAREGMGKGGRGCMKRVRMFVLSLRGVHFGFWSHLGCSGQSAIICSREGLPQGCARRIINKIYLVRFKYGLFLGSKKPGPRPYWSPLGV